MVDVAESTGQHGQAAADLRAGLSLISLNQTITFTKYVRLVLPLDGYVFWVKADLLSSSALLNAGAFNQFAFNEYPPAITPAATVSVRGSLHYGSDSQQTEVANYTANRVVFTSEVEIQEFNEIGPNVLFIGEFDGIKFAFTQRQSLYRQMDLYHYVGDAVYSFMASQLVDKLEGFDTRNVVVSNSLPIWLALNLTEQKYPFPMRMPVQLFPSFLVPSNLPPVYGVVHIPPEATQALQSVPRLDSKSSHLQLASDRVRITLYGTRNFNALDFVDYVLNYIGYDGDPMGLMSAPIVRDEKQIQSELSVIAMRKTVEFQVSYTQQRIRDIARQLILHAFVTYHIGD